MELPQFEDGCKVRYDDRFVNENDSTECVARYVVLSLDGKQYSVLEDYHGDLDTIETKLKRPNNLLKDFDGIEVHVGDTVYSLTGDAYTDWPLITKYYGQMKVSKRNIFNSSKVLCEVDGERTEMAPVSTLTHYPPETLENIFSDFGKPCEEYWLCDRNCSECRAIVDNKRPYERYSNSVTCKEAMLEDIKQRIRRYEIREGNLN